MRTTDETAAAPRGPLLVWTSDARGVLTSVAGPGAPWTTEGSFAGRPVGEVLPRDARDELRRVVAEGSGAFRFEWHDHEYTVHVEPIRDAGGAAVGSAGVLTVNATSPSIERYRRVFEGAPLCIHVLDDAGRLVEINQAGLELLGVPDCSEVLGMRFLDAVHEDDRVRIGDLLREALAGRSARFEYRSVDGRVFDSCFVPLLDGPAPMVFGLSQDVTERSETEQALAESELRYRLLVERSPSCIHEIDAAGCLMSMNRAGLEMMGVDDESVIVGMPYLDAVAEHDVVRIRALMDHAYAGTPAMFEFEASNGHLFASSFVPITDDTGTVTRLMGLTQDVTERQLAQRALKESEQRLALALEAADLGLWDWRVPTDTLWVDDRWRALRHLGTRSAELDRGALFDGVHPDDLEGVLRRFERHLADETDFYDSEHRVQTRNDAWRWVHERGQVVERGEEGEPLRVTGTTVDVTERRQLEQQLLQSQKMESVGQLAGGIAHDFNNLLLLIQGGAELALVDVTAGRSPERNLGEIRRAAERAAELTRRLLSLGRRHDPELKRVDLHQVLDGVTELIGRLLPETIQVDYSRAAGTAWIDADTALLEQVVLNLCLNARDAMPSGGRLTLATRFVSDPRAGACVQVTVSDTGTGMDAETLRRAFDPFFTTKDAQSGTGLGLAMAYGIVQQHGGDIGLESRIDEGTRAVLSFPLRSPAPAGEAAETIGAGPLNGNETVLVVEDEAAVRELMRKVLEPRGYTVLEAPDGERGVELYLEHQDEVDLVVLDAVMPRMDGRAAAEAILTRRPEARILFVSGYRDETLPRGFLKAHELEVLEKPFSSELLLTRIREKLDAAPTR